MHLIGFTIEIIIKFTLRNCITVVDYLHSPLEHMYYSFHAVETNIKTLGQGLWNLYADGLYKFHTAGLLTMFWTENYNAYF